MLGRGLLAREVRQAPRNYRRTVIFASGVSSSLERDPLAYIRENILLSRAIRLGRPLVYFGSLSSGPVNRNRYYQHKFKSERRITRASPKNRIINLPQVFGIGGNPDNLINLFLHKLLEGKRPPITEDALRFVLPANLIPALAAPRIGKSVSIVHNFPISPAHLLSILDSEVTGHKAFFKNRPKYNGNMAIRISELRKRRKLIVLREITLERIERELRSYVRKKRS